MLLQVFSIFDSATKSWAPPMYSRNNGQMIRDFADAVADSQTKLAKHPMDYALFELGSFDDDKCKFNLHATPIRLCLAMDYVKAPAAGSGGGLGASPQERSEATGALSVVPKSKAGESGSK